MEIKNEYIYLQLNAKNNIELIKGKINTPYPLQYQLSLKVNTINEILSITLHINKKRHNNYSNYNNNGKYKVKAHNKILKKI